MGKAWHQKRTLAKKAERARRAKAEQPPPQSDLTEQSERQAEPSPRLQVATDTSVQSDTPPDHHGLQQSEPSAQGGDQHAVPASVGGTGADRRERAALEIIKSARGSRDVTLMGRYIASPDWPISDTLCKALVTRLTQIGFDQILSPRPDANGKPQRWSETAQVRALRVLSVLKEGNERKLLNAKKVRQRDTMIRHGMVPGVGGETTNVVIILPEKADPREFALPSERVIDAEPSGNGGNGKHLT